MGNPNLAPGAIYNMDNLTAMHGMDSEPLT